MVWWSDSTSKYRPGARRLVEHLACWFTKGVTKAQSSGPHIHSMYHLETVAVSELKSTYAEFTTNNLFKEIHTCDKRLQCNKT